MLPGQAKFRPRRRHRKSRNGCMECKRRRIKCDEVKPSCSRCILTMQQCIYGNTQPDQLLPTPSPRTSSLERQSPPLLESLHLSQKVEVDTSDTALYHHYLTHTSKTLTANKTDHHAIQICLPTLALKSKTVFHSILALSAACLCCDMIYSDTEPDVSTVSHILMTGYRHYNLASERLRELISRPSAANAEPLLAAPPALVPFVTASQQINHWLSNRGAPHFHSLSPAQSQKLLTCTPRDVIVISRGISATIRALEQANLSPETCFSPPKEEIDSMDEYTCSSPESHVETPPSHKHPMYHIIARTSQSAFAKLQDRIDSALFFSSSPSDALTACADAFKVLDTLREAVFPSSHSNQPLPPSMTKSPTLPQVPSWLAHFTARPSTPTSSGYMTRPFLSFLVQAPYAYLELVLPLLDKRLEGPSTPSPHQSPIGEVELNVEQALALDIYAHWSVLMILVGEESWWIGKLPDITLSGMVNRYGEGFVNSLLLGSGNENGNGNGEGEWWPGSMLRVEREVGRYR
ncbi:hypothetical protein BDV18DRAFT_140153 [Aspergillus unguis]